MVKRERLEHIKAYEYYFQSGGLLIKKNKNKSGIARGSKWYEYISELTGRRSILQVAKKFNVSRTAVYNWCRSFNWKERVRERDKLINTKVNERLERLKY